VNENKSIRLEVADGFYLSPIVRADKAAYLEHFADPEIARNLLAIPFPYTEADADWWLDRCEELLAPQLRISLSVRHQATSLVPSASLEHFRLMLIVQSSVTGWRGLIVGSHASRHPHILRLRISTAPNSSAFCYAFLLQPCFAPRTGEGWFSARRSTQASPPQARHLPGCSYLWTYL
jgi:hypothetical protein